MSSMSDLHAALSHFVDVWGDAYLADDLAGKLSCTEANALRDLFRAVGDAVPGAEDAATLWGEAHAVHDDEGDEHYTGGAS